MNTATLMRVAAVVFFIVALVALINGSWLIGAIAAGVGIILLII